MASDQNYERLEERIVSVNSFNPIIEQKGYDMGKLRRFPIIPNPVKDQMIILYNNVTGAVITADESHIPLPNEIRRKSPNNQVLISLQSKHVSIDMNIRASNYASFFRIHVSANVRITNGTLLFEQYRSNLNNLGVDIGNAIANECFEEVRKIGRKFAPKDYAALEEELDARMPTLMSQHSYDIFSSLEIINMRFHVNLTDEHEDILHKATYATYQNDAQKAIWMSEAANMQMLTQLMNSGSDADVWLEVAQGKLSPTEAIDYISSRNQGKRGHEIEVLEKLIQQGVLSDKDIQVYMKNILDHAVDSSDGENPSVMMLEDSLDKKSLPTAEDISDQFEED